MSDDSALSVPEKTRGKEKRKKGEKHTSKRIGEGGGRGEGGGVASLLQGEYIIQLYL